MHFPFRRSAPVAAWDTRLPQLQRGATAGVEAPPPPPEPAGLLVAVTSARRPALSVRDLLANPAAAGRVPASELVSALVTVDAENRVLRRRLHARKAELREMKAATAQHVMEDAELRGRLRALEDVISALHANLEDLRLQRDQLLAR